VSRDVRALDDLLRTLSGLKRVPRTGWLDRGVAPAETESVADHSYLTALIAWILALDEPDLDAGRVLRLAMLHDLAEAIAGDPPPYAPEDVPDPADREAHHAFFRVRHVRTPEQREVKARAEEAAFAHLASLMPEGARAEFAALWQEYGARETPEARFVKEVDILEAYLESRHHAARRPEVPVEGFTDMALQELTHPLLTAIRDAVQEREAVDTPLTQP
jgi:putative hydrolase of HD superfamily